MGTADGRSLQISVHCPLRDAATSECASASALAPLSGAAFVEMLDHRCCCERLDLEEAAELFCLVADPARQGAAECSFLCCSRPSSFCGTACCLEQESCGLSLKTGEQCCTTLEPRVDGCCLTGRGYHCAERRACCLDDGPECRLLCPSEGRGGVPDVLLLAVFAFAAIVICAGLVNSLRKNATWTFADFYSVRAQRFRLSETDRENQHTRALWHASAYHSAPNP